MKAGSTNVREKARAAAAVTVSAFTLVEIMIVVVILGILAALVLPYYNDISEEARASAVLGELQAIRRQLQVYQAEHNGELPALTEMWGNLTSQTDVNHNPGTDFGPYLLKQPANPWSGGAICAADNSADWEYDELTGTIRAVVAAGIIAQMGLSGDNAVAAP